VAREGEIATGTSGPPVANAVRHAQRKLRDISFLPEALEYQIVCEFRNQYRESESTSLRQPIIDTEIALPGVQIDENEVPGTLIVEPELAGAIRYTRYSFMDLVVKVCQKVDQRLASRRP
jgi:hypothetical protein